ncbi:MAG TPA: Tic20 family protein [Chroococcidiopsis sp.]
MTRGLATPLDRTFACLPYLLPLIESMAFAAPILSQFPLFGVIFIPILPFIQLYSTIPFAGLIVFFGLYLGVVRNEQISHFIRFNTMQALLIDIALVLVSLVLSVLGPALGGGLLLETVMNVAFLGTLVAVGYSVIQSIRGLYAEIPTISEAVHMQVR